MCKAKNGTSIKYFDLGSYTHELRHVQILIDKSGPKRAISGQLMGAAVLKSPKGSCILLAVQCTLSLIHDNKKLTTEFPDKQQLSVDRRLSFGGITIITNEPRPAIEPHFARENKKLL